MIIGVAKEIKPDENRVALTPAGTQALTREGHRILVENGAASGSGFSEDQNERVGAIMCAKASDVWAQAEMIVKAKEPLPAEHSYFRP